MWKVQASCDPPTLVYTLGHGDVIIAPADQAKPPPADRTSELVCTRKTLDALKQMEEVTSRKEDPWLVSDPWQQQTPVKTASVAPSATELKQLQASVERNVLTALKSTEDVQMGEADPKLHELEARMQKLEASVTTNLSQTASLANKVSEVENQVQAQGQALSKQLDDRFNNQLKDIEALLSKRPRNNE